MASSGNFSTMNPLHRTSTNVQYSNGNLTFSPTSSWSQTTFTRNNMVIPKDKKIYMEVYFKNQSAYYAMFGVSAVNAIPTSSESGSTGTIMIYNDSTRINGTRTDGVVTVASQGDVVGIAIDGSNNKVWFAINNTWQLSGDPANGTNEIGTVTTNSTVGTDITFAFNQNSVSILTANFGQDSTFAGGKTSGSANATDSNSVGDFYYTPPTDFLALSSANLSISSDIDPAQTDDDYPQKQFGVVTYTGNGTSNAITGLGFQPDLVWAKSRSSAQNHILIDSSRGQGLLFSSLTNAEQTAGGPFMTSYDSDGFTLSSSGSNPNDSGQNYVAWCWRANGGVTSSNTDGATTTTVQANTKAGFSIVEWPQYTPNSTFGHGLSKAPTFIISKLTGLANWALYHTGLDSGKVLYFTNSAQFTSSIYNSTAPTSSVFSLGASYAGSGAGISYCWHDVEGFQKFGKYTANSVDNDGAPFIYTGFRPRLLAIKGIDTTNSWMVFDTARETANPIDQNLHWDASASEATENYRDLDILSNGFKIRTNNGALNDPSGDEYIYCAWGDVPFKYNNTF